MEPRVAVPAAGLKEEHLQALVLGQPSGKRTARRTGADDDDVVVRAIRHGGRISGLPAAIKQPTEFFARLAGGLGAGRIARGKLVGLVGRVAPGRTEVEGPFGEWTGHDAGGTP